jgi:hypothetical protein
MIQPKSIRSKANEKKHMVFDTNDKQSNVSTKWRVTMVTPKNKGLKRLACQYVCEQNKQIKFIYLY